MKQSYSILTFKLYIDSHHVLASYSFAFSCLQVLFFSCHACAFYCHQVMALSHTCYPLSTSSNLLTLSFSCYQLLAFIHSCFLFSQSPGRHLLLPSHVQFELLLSLPGSVSARNISLKLLYLFFLLSSSILN